MSIRRLSYRQIKKLAHRVLWKEHVMLHRACPANHWEFRRIPSYCAL